MCAMPVTMSGSPSSPKDGVAAQKYSVMPPKQQANKYLKDLPENEARQNARMRSKVSETLGGKSRRMTGQLDQFVRATGKGGGIDGDGGRADLSLEGASFALPSGKSRFA